MIVLMCPRDDGGTLVELKTKVPVDAAGGLPVSGYWCDEGHKLTNGEQPVEVEKDD